MAGIHNDLRRILTSLQRPRWRILIDANSHRARLIDLLQAFQHHPDLFVHVVGKQLVRHGVDIPSYASFDAIPTGLDFHAVIRYHTDDRPPQRICDARCRFILLSPPTRYTDFDEIWTSSARAAALLYPRFSSHRIQILPLGIHCPSVVSKKSLSDRFVFLFSGPLLPRLGPDIVLRAFDLAFSGSCRYENCSGEPLFLLHTTQELGYAASEIFELERLAARNPRIQWLRQQTLSESEFEALMISADSFVMIPRIGELPIITLEAMARGISLLTSSSRDEVTRGEFVDLAPAVPTTCGDHALCRRRVELNAFCSENGTCDWLQTMQPSSWLEISPQVLATILHRVATAVDAARWRGALAREFVRRRHCWEKIASIGYWHLERLLRNSKRIFPFVEDFTKISRLQTIYTTDERFYLISSNRLWWAYVDTVGRLRVYNTASLKLRWMSHSKENSCIPSCHFRLSSACHVEVHNWHGKLLWRSSEDAVSFSSKEARCDMELTNDGRLIVVRQTGHRFEVLWSSTDY